MCLSSFKHLHKRLQKKKIQLCVSYNIRLWVFAIGHLSLLTEVQNTYSTEIFFTRRAVTCVETHLEDLQQFAHDLYHLHVIKP